MGEEVAALKLVQSIEANTKHYVEILARAVDDCMPEPSADPTYVKPQPWGLFVDHSTDPDVDSRMTFLMS